MEKSRLVDVSLYLIRFYRAVSALGAARCRFYPTCSAFAQEAFIQYGFWKGLRCSVFRILKCHPFHPGGYDPLIS